MDVDISPWAGPGRRRTGLYSWNGGPCLPCIQGPAWLCSGSGWFAARATPPPGLMGSDLPPSSGRTRRAPTIQKALRRRAQGAGAADGASPVESAFLAAARRLTTKTQRAGGPMAEARAQG